MLEIILDIVLLRSCAGVMAWSATGLMILALLNIWQTDRYRNLQEQLRNLKQDSQGEEPSDDACTSEEAVRQKTG